MLTLNRLFSTIKKDIENTNTFNELDAIRIKYLGKKGILNSYIRNIKDFSFEEKKKYSMMINHIKKTL